MNEQTRQHSKRHNTMHAHSRSMHSPRQACCLTLQGLIQKMPTVPVACVPRTAGGASLLAWVCMAGSRVRSGELGGRENTICCGRERRKKGRAEGANPPLRCEGSGRAGRRNVCLHGAARNRCRGCMAACPHSLSECHAHVFRGRLSALAAGDSHPRQLAAPTPPRMTGHCARRLCSECRPRPRSVIESRRRPRGSE